MFREAEILKTPNLHLSVVWYLERLHELLNQYKLILCGLSLQLLDVLQVKTGVWTLTSVSSKIIANYVYIFQMENIIKSYGGRSRPIWISQKISIDIWDISVICSGEIVSQDGNGITTNRRKSVSM